eukprot:COSAG01_NODE_4432_length_5031_cov_3.848540_4_plen_54_part_00
MHQQARACEAAAGAVDAEEARQQVVGGVHAQGLVEELRTQGTISEKVAESQQS